MKIDIVVLGGPSSIAHSPWELGALYQSEATPVALQQTTQRLLQESSAEGVLFWDARLGMPDASTIARLIDLPGHLWHAGLCLGMGGLPRLMHFTRPTWMFNVDPPQHVDATSWRISLRACLIRMDALRHLGGIATDCTSLAGASLDLGLRALTSGLLPRHIPWMLPQTHAQPVPESLPIEDEFAIARAHYPSWQVFWAGMRGAAKGALSLAQAVRHTLARPRTHVPPVKWFPPLPDSALSLDDLRATRPRITILIPTIDRYAYLRVLLDQCRRQTLIPHEILVIDQTDAEQRDQQLVHDFADLPLRVITMDEAGQCRSRNLGLQISSGDYIMFLDDDDEIPPNLLETHLRNLLLLRADVSSGVVYEPPQQPREVQKDRIRASDVFPTNITLLRREILMQSGLFDLAFDRRTREDHDLGMRIYLNGGMMVMDERMPILHHHAPRGGLRTHNMRVVTRLARRRSVYKRNLTSPTDAYIALRYYGQDHLREETLLTALTNLRTQGSLIKQLVGFLIGLVLLPDSMGKIRTSVREAYSLLDTYPQIPGLNDRSATEGDTNR